MNNEKEFKDLPEGWKWVRLGEVIEEVKEKNKLNKNLPILTSSRKGIYLQDEYFNRIVASKDISNYKMIKKGEFTYRSMSDDETFVFNRLEDIPVGLVSPAYFVFQVKEGYSGDYLKYLLNSSVEIKRQIYKEIKGTTRVALKFNQLTNFIVPLPPLPEQQKIAEILETIDNAIEKTDKIIEKYKRIKQGLMQDLLTKGIDENGNIRNEKTHKFKDSPLGRIPEEWEVVRLEEVGELRKEKALTPKNNIYIGLENIEKGTGKINGFIPSDEIKGISNIFKTGDILFGKLRPNLRKFWYAKYSGYCSTEFLVIFPINEKIINEFLYLVIGSNNFLNLAESKVFGTKMPRTSWDILKNYTFPLPPLPEQQRIAEILSQIDQTIEKEEHYKEKLKRIKQGLMEDLLTGTVRVNHLVEEEEK